MPTSTAQGGPPRRKFTLDIFKKFAKSRKITNFERFAYGPTRPSLRLWKQHKLQNFFLDVPICIKILCFVLFLKLSFYFAQTVRIFLILFFSKIPPFINSYVILHHQKKIPTHKTILSLTCRSKHQNKKMRKGLESKALQHDPFSFYFFSDSYRKSPRKDLSESI